MSDNILARSRDGLGRGWCEAANREADMNLRDYLAAQVLPNTSTQGKRTQRHQSEPARERAKAGAG